MVLEQIQENDILIFLDIGFEFHPNKREMLLEMIEAVDENEIMGLETGVASCAEKIWNKADLLAHYNLLEDQEFLDSPQLAAGMVFCKKTPKAQNMIQEWLDAFYNHYHLIDDSPSKIPNLPTFKENRHDQSIWNVIAKREKIKNFPPEFYHKRNGEVALSYNRNKIYLPNKANETKELNEFIRGSGRYSFRLSLLHLQNQSLHYRVLDSVLIDFNLIEDYKKWFNGYINGDLKTLFEAAKIILQKIPNWHILKELTIAKLKEKKGEAYIEEFQKLYKNTHQQIFVSFVEMESVVAAFGDKIKNTDFIAQALSSKSQELESLKSQYDSKIKELQVNLKTAQDTLSSLPTKKQTLEIKNLESDLKIKELKTKQIEKELGYSYNVLEELDLKKQELIKVKQQLDSKTKELESKNTGLESNLNYPIFKGNLSYLNTMTSAKDRIHNHLSYKLGKAMIENSKSILGYIRMPYVLSYIKEQHNQEQKQYQEQIKKNPNLKLPKLESYKDYKEALKEKECFTYKLGEALMKADKTWYKGGYIALMFEVGRLNRELKIKKKLKNKG